MRYVLLPHAYFLFLAMIFVEIQSSCIRRTRNINASLRSKNFCDNIFVDTSVHEAEKVIKFCYDNRHLAQKPKEQKRGIVHFDSLVLDYNEYTTGFTSICLIKRKDPMDIQYIPNEIDHAIISFCRTADSIDLFSNYDQSLVKINNIGFLSLSFRPPDDFWVNNILFVDKYLILTTMYVGASGISANYNQIFLFKVTGIDSLICYRPIEKNIKDIAWLE
ncbi:MAG: hypothetical protein EPGJADBJ_00649 [Saprospiraceae bacterium]|nr:hypothetical protein [Saprospiraceae bacterium]